MANGPEPDKPGELAVRGASYVEAFVSLVRDKAIRPVLVGARVVIVAVIGIALGLVVATAVLVGLVRLFTSDVFGGRVWATDLLFGGMLLGAGAFLIWHGFRPRKGAPGG